MLNSREGFLRKLQDEVNPGQLLNSQGIMMNRIVRDHRPENKILPRSGASEPSNFKKRTGVEIPSIPSFNERKKLKSIQNTAEISEKIVDSI
ncbi:unnamed protein product [Blepharisma stoltei]|uniref:Uncharacterized protein n=1 Tax=Blepharisma stoltei TaxID=1481888 RepID=A0AAU9JL07_9CILI|nr:unnamed protein product [Blepharisma stoltei]